MNRKLITVFDLLLITVIVAALIFTVTLFASSDRGGIAVVTVDNKEVMRLDLALDAEETVKTRDGYNIIVISKGKCRVLRADCRDGICKNRGEIYKKGESIVCLPHKLIVEIR